MRHTAVKLSVHLASAQPQALRLNSVALQPPQNSCGSAYLGEGVRVG
jgi:hypothetical protein